ncbi:MAG: hypothetical protein H6838_05090 [Planctomycetes bacterium]|nr:hypothetical protein [Planctomycetota bacterium]
MNGRTSWRWVIGTAVGCQAVLGLPLVVCSWLCVPAMEWLGVLGVFPFLIAVCALLGGLLATPLRPAYGLRAFAWGSLGVLAWILFGAAAARLRMATVTAATERARPLIVAIDLFERDRGAPPATLQDLVPDYLPEVPTTGLVAYPAFAYAQAAPSGAAGSKGAGWRLSLPCPLLFDFDALVYRPARAGEHSGRWVYVND